MGMNLHLLEMHSYPGCYVRVVSVFLSSNQRGVSVECFSLWLFFLSL